MHQIFQRIFDTEPHAPPTICRECKDVIDVAAHTLDDCEASQQDQAHQANQAAFIRSMQRELAGVM